MRRLQRAQGKSDARASLHEIKAGAFSPRVETAIRRLVGPYRKLVEVLERGLLERLARITMASTGGRTQSPLSTEESSTS
jgi:hypothetical protein